MKVFVGRSPLVLSLVGVVLLFGAGAILWAGWSWGGSSNKPAPEDTPPPAPVKWMEARQFFVEEWTETLGTTVPLPDRVARITAPVEGRVLSVLQAASSKAIIEGQRVKKGDVIVQLDATLIKANRDKLEAGQNELKQLITQADLALKLAEVDVMRLAELAKTTSPDSKMPLVSRVEMEKARLAQLDAESKLKAAEFREITGRKELEALDKQLSLYSLHAPIDGRLGRLLVVQGQTLATGTLVADVIDLDDQIDVLCFVPPRVAQRLKKGQPARIGGVEDGQGGTAAGPEGKVQFIAAQAEVDTGNFAVKIRFSNKDMALRANTTVRIRVLTTPGKACLTLPESALFEDQDPPAVIVVENYKKVTVKDGDKVKEVETGTARKLRAKVGIRDRVLHLVEIISLEDPEKKWTGTMEEARFVVERGQGLRNGDAIRLEVDEE
jgi:RND family efflux transporter MFP subunit